MDSPYFDDEAAPNWLVGIGKGTIPGFAARRAPASPLADGAAKELLHVATGGVTPELRALAIKALARSRDSGRDGCCVASRSEHRGASGRGAGER